MSATAIILGSGTSNGVPMLGMRYSPSFLQNPKNHRTRASLMIEGPEGNFLVDCPPELRLQMHWQGLYRIDHVLITHTHADHVMGMDDLRSVCMMTKRNVPVYSRPEHQEDIRRIFPYAFQEFPPGVQVPRFDLNDVPEEGVFCGLPMRFFHVHHGKVMVTGLRVGGFAYITDVSKIPEDVYPLLEGLETLVLDAVRFEPHPNHLHFDAAVEVAERIGAETTFFTHLSSDYDHDAFEEQLPANLRLAYDGLRIPINL